MDVIWTINVSENLNNQVTSLANGVGLTPDEFVKCATLLFVENMDRHRFNLMKNQRNENSDSKETIQFIIPK